MDVILGPALELHRGVHGALLEHPPPGVVYDQRSHRYHYRFRAGLFPPNPFDRLAVDEAVEYDAPMPAFVHSCRLPVRNPVPWVVEHDDFAMALRYGQFFAVGSEASIRSGTLDEKAIALRQRTLLARHLEPRCRAVLFWTEFARRAALGYLEATGLCTGPALDTLRAKTDVVSPALPALAAPAREGAVHVLCSGRTFADKGGELALEVFGELARRFGTSVRLTLVVDTVASPVDTRSVRVLPLLPRQDYLKLLAQAHIFFSPTSFESFGMALLEAAAAGLAIVTSCGDGMEHVSEMFDEGRHACLVPNEWPRERKVRAYVAALDRLIRDGPARREMGANGRRLTESGPFSPGARDRKLQLHYSRMLDTTPGRARHRRTPPASGTGPRSAAGRRPFPGKLEARDFSEEYCWLEIAARRRDGHVRIRL